MKKIVFLLFICSFVLFACSGFEEKTVEDDVGLKIVTTIPPLYSLTAYLVDGVDVSLTNILPPNASPHTYQMTFETARAVAEADVIVKNGLELELFLENVLKDAGGLVVVASDGLDLIKDEHYHNHDHDYEHDHDHGHDGGHGHDGDHGHEHAHDHDYDHDGDHYDDHDHDHDHDHGHDHEHEHDHDHDHDHDHGHSHHDHHHGEYNPHVWLSPLNAIVMSENTVSALMKADPENAEIYEENFARLKADLNFLHAEISSRLSELEVGPYIVFHDAYPYFERDFGVRAFAFVEEFPGKEPSARYIAGLVDLIEKEGIKVVFTEPQFSPKLVQTLAEDYGLEVAELDPLGKGLSKNCYFDMMRGNVAVFEKVFN